MVCYLSYICRVFHHFHTQYPTFRTVRTELLAIICHYIVVIYIAQQVVICFLLASFLVITIIFVIYMS